MAIQRIDHEILIFVFGILGSIVSFLVFMAPVPTFVTIYKKKTSEGFQSIPYVTALSSAILFVYYGSLKEKTLLITVIINAVGCAIEVIYLVLHIIYAPKEEKIFTIKTVLLFNVLANAAMMAFTLLIFGGSERADVVGCICAAFNVGRFAAPLSIMNRVIRTRSVEYMPISLSICLTLCGILWFFYGLFVKDLFIAAPNVLGFLLGLAQVTLYMLYKDCKNENKVCNNENKSVEP